MSAFRRNRRGSGDEGWSDFLLDPVVNSPLTPTPLSALGISTHQVQRAHHEDVSSFVVAPEGVAESATALGRKGLTVHATGTDSREGFDALVRVDVVGPVPLDAVYALGGGRRTGRVVDIGEADSAGI